MTLCVVFTDKCDYFGQVGVFKLPIPNFNVDIHYRLTCKFEEHLLEGGNFQSRKFFSVLDAEIKGHKLGIGLFGYPSRAV